MILVQAFLKGGGALKFFLIARYVGPEGVGTLGIVLLLIAITDLLTETGVYQAMVQKPGDVSGGEKSAIFSFQILRSFFLTLTLAVVGLFVYHYHEQLIGSLILCYSVLPFTRSLLNLRYQWSIRDGDFKYLAIVDGIWIASEVLLVIVLLNAGHGVMGAGMAAIAAEAVRVTVSWFVNPISVRLFWSYSLLREYVSYGKWIWKANVLTILLNNFDKLIVIKLLGVESFGIYQVSSKIAQLFLVEWVQAFSNFLFAAFSSKNRSSRKEAESLLYRVLSFVLPTIALLVLFCLGFTGQLVGLLLGGAWSDVGKYVLLFLFPMGVGGVIALLVPFLRGIGRPSIVAKATFYQLLALGLLTSIAGYLGSLSLLIVSLGLAGVVALLYMIFGYVWRREVIDG